MTDLQPLIDKLAQPGELSSEYRQARSAGIMAVVSMILGLIVTLGGTIAEMLGHDTKAAILAGLVITIAAKVQQTLVALGYTQARSLSKSDSAEVIAKVGSPAALNLSLAPPLGRPDDSRNYEPSPATVPIAAAPNTAPKV